MERNYSALQSLQRLFSETVDVVRVSVYVWLHFALENDYQMLIHRL